MSFHQSTPPPAVTTQYLNHCQQDLGDGARLFYRTESLQPPRRTRAAAIPKDTRNDTLCWISSQFTASTVRINRSKLCETKRLRTVLHFGFSHQDAPFGTLLSYTIFFSKFRLHLFKTEHPNIQRDPPLGTYSRHNAEINTFGAYKRTTEKLIGYTAT